MLLFSLQVLAQENNQLQFYTRTWNDPNLYGCTEKLLLFKQGDSVRAYCNSFCDAVGGTRSFLVAKTSGNTISGIRYIPQYYDDGEFMGLYDYSFKIIVMPDNSIIQYYSTSDSGPVVLSLSDAKYKFYGGIKEVTLSPTPSSKVVFQTDVKNDRILILRIGKFEKIGDTYDFWYEVQVDNKQGWLFGGLNLGHL